jgi:uncharacterized membrane protein
MTPNVTPYEDVELGSLILPGVTPNGGSNPFFDSLFNNISDFAFFPLDSILSFLNTAWLIYTVLAYCFCIFLLVLYVYASTGKKQLDDLDTEARESRERIYEEHFKSGPKNNRIQDMFDHVSSDNPSDWKLAIIEADIILDQILKENGYSGSSLGERLKSISPTQLQSLDDAWQAHKVRNQIAHSGADFILTQKLAQDTVKQYRRVFHELGVS